MTTVSVFQVLMVYTIPVLLAITLHEAAHAYAAWYFGDDTARSLGRVTLNPIKHIDPLGTLAMPLLLYLSTGGSFVFGYARPVPVLARKLRNPRRDMALVALAGPIANLLQALLWLALVYGLQARNISSDGWLVPLCRAGVLTNLAMFAFNLFPMLPLDGGRILSGLLPPTWAHQFARLEPFGFYIVLLLLITGVIDKAWMQPVFQGALKLISLVLIPLRF